MLLRLRDDDRAESPREITASIVVLGEHKTWDECGGRVHFRVCECVLVWKPEMRFRVQCASIRFYLCVARCTHRGAGIYTKKKHTKRCVWQCDALVFSTQTCMQLGRVEIAFNWPVKTMWFQSHKYPHKHMHTQNNGRNAIMCVLSGSGQPDFLTVEQICSSQVAGYQKTWARTVRCVALLATQVHTHTNTFSGFRGFFVFACPNVDRMYMRKRIPMNLGCAFSQHDAMAIVFLRVHHHHHHGPTAAAAASLASLYVVGQSQQPATSTGYAAFRIGMSIWD